ncbi:hypothetical protein ABPG75_002858 [Micractinium tetrahymenae]
MVAGVARWSAEWERQIQRQQEAAAAAAAAVIAGLLGGVIQLVAILTKHDLGHLVHSPLGAASPCLAVLVLLVSGMLVPALAPRWFERHRTPLFAASRLLYFSLPTVRSSRGYAYILQSVPSQGRFSKLRDTWLLALGTRGLALLLGPVFLPLPLLLHVLVMAFAIQRVSAAGEICSMPMLQHPLWQRRIRWAHLTAEMLPLVGPPHTSGGDSVGSSSSAAAAGGSLTAGGCSNGSGALECRVFVAFFQAFMAALSVLLAARLEAPRSSAAVEPAAEAAAAAPAAAPAAGAPGGAVGRSWLARPLRWLRGLVAEVEAFIRQLCEILSGRCWPGVVQLACWCLLLSFLWNLAAWMEKPHPTLPSQAA